MTLHRSTVEAIQTIDAGFFSGNEFRPTDDLAEIENFLARWNREVVRIKEQHMENIALFVLTWTFDRAIEVGLYAEEDLPMTPDTMVSGMKTMNEATKRLVKQGYVDFDNGTYVANQAGCDYVKDMLDG